MRFTVTYGIKGTLAEVKKKAFGICVEQTIEFPYELVKDNYIKNTIVGKIKSIKKTGSSMFQSEISYDDSTAGKEFTQLLNVIFGNTSIKPGIRVEKINLSPGLLKMFPGPKFGISGLRKLTGVYNRPLLCSAIKPMGTSAAKLADMAYKFALGGIDMIKDDHGLANQKFSPFNKRVLLAAKAVKKANKETGGHCLYAPNITADGDGEILRRAGFAKRAGAGALVISPGLTGFNAVRKIAEDKSINLPILFHPALLGSFTVSKGSGISHFALYGQIARLCGADIVIFPNFGGRFSFSKEECRSIADGCKVKMGRIKTILPGPGGGMTLQRMPELKKFYGNDVIFLVGGGLVANGPDLISSVKSFRDLAG
jgi:ribulose-bisphosphate carboxylase large chain